MKKHNRSRILLFNIFSLDAFVGQALQLTKQPRYRNNTTVMTRRILMLFCVFTLIFSLNISAEVKKTDTKVLSPQTVAKKDNNRQDLPPQGTNISDKSPTAKQSRGEKTPPPKDTDYGFYSIEENGFTVAHGSRWEFTSFDDFGRIAFIVVFEQDKQIEKSDFLYWDDSTVLQKKTRTTTDTLSVSDYNQVGKIKQTIVSCLKDNTELKKSTYFYDKNNKLIKNIVKTADHIIESRYFFKADGTLANIKQYQDGLQIMLTEYSPDGSEIVYVFERGVKYLVSKKDTTE